ISYNTGEHAFASSAVPAAASPSLAGEAVAAASAAADPLALAVPLASPSTAAPISTAPFAPGPRIVSEPHRDSHDTDIFVASLRMHRRPGSASIENVELSPPSNSWQPLGSLFAGASAQPADRLRYLRRGRHPFRLENIGPFAEVAEQ